MTAQQEVDRRALLEAEGAARQKAGADGAPLMSQPAGTRAMGAEPNAAMRALAVRRHLAQLGADGELAASAPDEAAVRRLNAAVERGASCNELLALVCGLYAERRAFAYSVGGAADFRFVTYAQLYQRVKTLAAGAPPEPERAPRAELLCRRRQRSRVRSGHARACMPCLCSAGVVLGAVWRSLVHPSQPVSRKRPCPFRAAVAGFAAEGVLQRSGFMGISGFASLDWVTAEFACQYLGACIRRSASASAPGHAASLEHAWAWLACLGASAGCMA
jgi:hypothetical protein